jgi:hypothetical protein
MKRVKLFLLLAVVWVGAVAILLPFIANSP